MLLYVTQQQNLHRLQKNILIESEREGKVYY